MAAHTEQSFTYKVVVLEKDGRFCLRIDELCLFAWGETLQGGYQDLQQQKERVIEDARKADLLRQLPDPYAGPLGAAALDGDRFRARRRYRAIVALIVAILLGVPIGGGLYALGGGVRQLATAINDTRNGVPHGREFWRALERGIERAADPSNDIDPDTRRKLLASLRVLAERYRPFLDALTVPVAPSDGAGLPAAKAPPNGEAPAPAPASGQPTRP